MRWVVYVDMDAFYVACELRDHPELVGQKVIVGPNPHDGPSRGVVLSASYEARRDGVRSAMPVMQADRLSPDAVWIAPHMEKYERVSHEIRAFLAQRATQVLPLSIDEAAVFIDVEQASAAETWARRLQQDLKAELALSASLGVAVSRVVAKIASDREKPGGLVVVPPETTATFLAPLSVRVVPGIGPKTEKALAELGVRTMSDVSSSNVAGLRRALGGFADELRDLARGIVHEPTEIEARDPVSRSTDHTFPSDVQRMEDLEVALHQMARELSQVLDHEHLRYQNVTVGLRWSDFTRTQRGRSLPATQRGTAALESAAVRILRDAWAEEQRGRGRPLRTLSLRVSRLSSAAGGNRPLESFAAEEDRGVN
ncbi:MAG: DNA polymerase IV [Thermoplasmata archaeon]